MGWGHLSIGHDQEIDVTVVIEVPHGEGALQAGGMEVVAQNLGGAAREIPQDVVDFDVWRGSAIN